MAIDWTKIVVRYKGQWITLKDDEQTVISSGKTATDALATARKKGFTSPILARMPKDPSAYYVG